MAEISFIYKGIEIKIQSNLNDKMKDIINKFILKIENNNKQKYFIYNGNQINEVLTFYQQANETDKKSKKMNIVVEDVEGTYIKEEKKKSKEIICPECEENILINIKDYKITLYECKNNHIKNKILLDEFENTQKIDISKIKCNKCFEKSLNKIYNNEFYVCNSCRINLCPICKSIHNKAHNIIKYEDKNFICKKHNDSFIRFCKKCKENICLLCEKDHKNHENIYLGDMIINKYELLKENENLTNIIDKLRMIIEEIKKILDKVLNNIEIYNKINKEIIDNYDERKRNYYLLMNINEINKYNLFTIFSI